MKIQEINAFLAVYKYGSFTKAAEKMFTTQPTISWQISSLEREIGQPLISRGKGIHQTTLTPAGKVFYPQAMKWAQLWAETEELLSTPDKDNYRFSCVPSLSAKLFSAVQGRFCQEMPNCALTMTSRVSDSCFDAVEHGNFDVALICSVQPSSLVRVVPFTKENVLFVCREDAPYGDHVKLAELNVQNYIHALWTIEMNAWLKHWFGSSARPRFAVSSAQSASEFFVNPDIWMVVPAATFYTFPAGFRTCELDVNPPSRLSYLISKYPQREPYYSCLCGALTDYFSQIPGVEQLASG